MLMNEYLVEKNMRTMDEVDVYCKLEGLDPLYVRSTAAKRRREEKKSGRTAASLISRWMEWLKPSRLLSDRY